MLFSQLDFDRLHRDVAVISAQCLELKRALRCRWTGPMADEQRRLARLRRRATELYVLIARARGRFHLSSAPEESRREGEAWDREAHNDRIAARVALDYARREPVAESEVFGL